MSAITAWFVAEMQEVERQPPAPTQGVLMGCAAWGAKYAQRFAQYAMATVCESSSFEALRGRCRLVVATDNAGWPIIFGALSPLIACGIETQILVIPDAAVVEAKQVGRLALLGCAQNIFVRMAARAGMAFHMLMPDHLYEAGYFARMLELGVFHDLILQRGISADLERASMRIEEYRRPSGELVVAGLDLGSIGWEYLHPQMIFGVMSSARCPGAMPPTHQLLWRSVDFIHIASCRFNPVWMSSDAARRYKIGRSTLDSIAFAGERAYIVNADDDMVFLELSDEEKFGPPAVSVSMDEFTATCWRQACFSDVLMTYFGEMSEIPAKPTNNMMTVEDVNAQHAEICVALRDSKTKAALETVEGFYGGTLQLKMKVAHEPKEAKHADA